MEGCRAAIDRGVYPSWCRCGPRPGASSPTGAALGQYVREVYERVAPLLAEAGLMSQDARAGCVRCQACSALSTFERAFGGGRDGRPAGASGSGPG